MNQSINLPERHLVAAIMLDQGLPDAAIRFLTRVYDTLLNSPQSTCSEMARHYGCTPQAASKHLKVLVSNQYLDRLHYRAWALNRGKIDELLHKGENTC